LTTIDYAARPDSDALDGPRWPLARRFGVDAVLTDLAARAAVRDTGRESPADDIARLKVAGIGALRIPEELGGSGISLVELFAFVQEVAEADPSVAHALRNHFAFVELSLQTPNGSIRRRWLNKIAEDRVLIGGSFSELRAAKAGAADFATTLTPSDDGYRLTGDKFYSTGNIYFDYIFVKAVHADGRPVTVVVPTDRAGVDLTDDWDGIGQRLTGSGSTRYRDVHVHADEIVPEAEFSIEKDSYSATFPQLYLTTVVAGILRAVLADAVALVSSRRRNYYHGSAEEPRFEQSVQSTVGQISVNSYAASAIVADAARSLARVGRSRGQAREDAALQATLDAARAKISVDELASRATWQIFETGGASSIRSDLDLDRHWRNARTLASHNPDSYKLRYIGDYLLNDVRPPKASFF
jgi:alkylation response protein AidB-like acyl-CoA dehydrogenase